MVSIFTPWAKKVMYKYKEVGILGFIRGKCRVYFYNKINIFWKGCPYYPKRGGKDAGLYRNLKKK